VHSRTSLYRVTRSCYEILLAIPKKVRHETTILDPTAGQTARAARAHPEAVQRVLDPTDPHFGRFTAAGHPVGEVARIFDPTDAQHDSQLA